MTYGYIYKIEFPNGKHYIGQTISLEQRKRAHKSCSKKGDTTCLYNALRKYEMEDTFELIEIDTADTSEELCEKETKYIQEYNSYYLNEKGYNMTYGGECGTSGYVHTEEDNKKNSERRKKYFEDNPELRKKCSERMKKHFENPEEREKQSERTKKHYEKNSNAGNEHSEAMKKYYQENPDTKQKNGEKRKQYYKDNPEAKRNLSDGKGKNKPFDIFTIEGTFVKTFCYQFEARDYLQKEYHITSSIKTGDVLSGRKKSSAGFVFKYK